MPLLQIVGDNAKDGDQLGNSVLVFEDWASIGDTNSDTYLEICSVTC